MHDKAGPHCMWGPAGRTEPSAELGLQLAELSGGVRGGHAVALLDDMAKLEPLLQRRHERRAIPRLDLRAGVVQLGPRVGRALVFLGRALAAVLRLGGLDLRLGRLSLLRLVARALLVRRPRARVRGGAGGVVWRPRPASGQRTNTMRQRLRSTSSASTSDTSTSDDL